MRKILLFFFVISNYSVHAQVYQQDNTVQLINHKIIIPDGGTLAEALSLTQDWTESVLRKNENIEEVKLLIGDTQKDTIDLVVLYSFKKNVQRSTNEINQELIKQRWPGEGEFELFISELHRYINPSLNEKSLFKALVLK